MNAAGQKLKINIISETEFTVKGQGVHSAFIDMVNALRAKPDLDVLVNSRQPADIVHLHTVGFYSLGKYFKSNKHCVISAHIVPDSLRGSLALSSWWLPIFSRYLRYFYNRAKILIAVSEYTKKELEKLKLKPEIKVIPNGVNRQWFKFKPGAREKMRNRLKINQDRFVVISSGQVQPRKGVKTFFRLAKEMPDVQFIWVGGRPFGRLTSGFTEMEKMIREAPANLLFTGEIDYEQMPDYYNLADLFFLPSHQETFGLVINEAASTGLPVLLRDLPEFAMSFAPYYQAGNEKNFASLIKKFKDNKIFYHHYQELAEQLAQKYDITAIADQVITIYKKVLTSDK